MNLSMLLIQSYHSFCPGFELTVCNVQFAHRLVLNSKNCTSFFQTICNCNNQGLVIIFHVQKEDLGMLFYV